MMLLLLRNDSGDGLHRARINTAKRRQLLLQMSKHHTLHSNSSSRNGARAKYTRDDPQEVPAQATQHVATTPRSTTALQFRVKQGSVSQLVRPKFS